MRLASISESAIGLIETRGLAGALEAADTAAKTARVELLGLERIGGGLVCVRWRGDTASVQTAVRAARAAAQRVTEVIGAHVIPAPQVELASLGHRGSSPVKAAAVSGPEAAVAGAATDLEALPVTRLRQLARRTPGVSLRGRQVSRANRQQLLEALSAARAGDAEGQ